MNLETCLKGQYEHTREISKGLEQKGPLGTEHYHLILTTFCYTMDLQNFSTEAMA